MINTNLFGEKVEKNQILREVFIEPPFSVLDSKGGNCQNRKRQWKNLGIQSEIGRDVKCNAEFGGDLDENGLNKYGRKPMTSISVFDPALCELMYHWFCKPQGTILDVFAGGSVRGIVANYLGFKYTGIDIRPEQVNSNIKQANDILGTKFTHPHWITGDSDKVLDTINQKYDFLFTCPPYADLEVYSDLEGDISNMNYTEFYNAYRSIIIKSCGLLKADGYAGIVVGDVRNKKGNYIDFISATKKCFKDAGMKLYNEMILLQPLGTAMLRAGKVFNSGKKLTKVHENILIFRK